MKKFNKIAIVTCVTAAIFGMSLAYADSTDYNSNTTVQNPSANVSDAAITAQIKASFAKSKILHANKISVSAQNGVVFLEGMVNSNTQYEEAVSLAQSTNGVNNVNVDKFNVKDSKAPLTDTYITAKIKGALMKAKTEGQDISILSTHVETKDGVVYLSGTLNNAQEVTNAIAVAKTIDGVKDVKSALIVNNSGNNQ